MALRLRRGTDAERQLITPAEGELIYVTNTKELFVGDGTTLGGIRITGADDVPVTELNGLTDVSIGTLNDGDVLAYDSTSGVWSAVAPQSPEIVVGGNYQISIVGADSTILVNQLDNSLRGNLKGGDIFYNEINIAIDLESQLVLKQDGTVLVNLNSGEFFGTLIGDSVGQHFGPVIGIDSSVILSNTGELVGSLQGDVFYTSTDKLFDNTLKRIYDTSGNDLINLISGEFTGTLIGDSVGQHFGPVFGFDSSIVIDQQGKVIGDIEADLFFKQNGNIFVDTSAGIIYDVNNNPFIDLNLRGIEGDVRGNIQGNVINNDLTKILVDHNLEQFNGTLIGDVIGSVFADNSTLLIDGVSGKINLDDTVTGNIKTRLVDDFPRLIMVRESDIDIAASDLAYGSIQWRRNDINGEKTTALISGGNEAILIAQSNDGILGPDKFVVLDEGNMAIGGFVPTAKLDVRGDIKAESSITPGVYADATARDAAITSPAEGMMIFNQALQKFQGYVSDVGIAGGGAPTTTPGWIDLN